MSNCSVLRIGPIDSENGNASALRDAITSHFHDNGASAPSTADNRSDKNSSLTISNRYFDANVLLLELDQPINESSAKAIIHEEDGILLIFDASLSTSFDTLGQFHATAMQNDRAGELLRLCIGATHGPSPLSDGSKKSEEEYSRRVLWCLDHGYEYVEVDLTPEGMARGHDERDKDGFARVVEAIGTCMWSSHVMKKRNVGVGRIIGGAVGGGAGATASSKDSKNDASSNNNNTAGGGGSKPESQLNATKSKSEGNETKETTTITSSSPTNDVEREEAAMASLMKDIDSDKPADSDGNADSKKKEAMQQQKSQQQDEMAFHQLESVLSEAKLIREASKNNSMSDDERRERAGDTAMKLMGLLDSLGFDDEDTENEGCCSSSSDEEGA